MVLELGAVVYSYNSNTDSKLKESLGYLVRLCLNTTAGTVAFNPSTQEAETGISQFEGSLLYIESSLHCDILTKKKKNQ